MWELLRKVTTLLSLIHCQDKCFTAGSGNLLTIYWEGNRRNPVVGRENYIMSFESRRRWRLAGAVRAADALLDPGDEFRQVAGHDVPDRGSELVQQIHTRIVTHGRTEVADRLCT